MDFNLQDTGSVRLQFSATSRSRCPAGHHDGLQPAGHRLREVAENCPVPGGILPGQRVRLPSTLISSQRDGALILSDLAVQIIVKSRPSLEILKNSNSNISCYHLILYIQRKLFM